MEERLCKEGMCLCWVAGVGHLQSGGLCQAAVCERTGPELGFLCLLVFPWVRNTIYGLLTFDVNPNETEHGCLKSLNMFF